MALQKQGVISVVFAVFVNRTYLILKNYLRTSVYRADELVRARTR